MRTLEEVTKEYAHQVQVAGETQYRIAILSEDLARMNAHLKELNKEALDIQDSGADANQTGEVK